MSEKKVLSRREFLKISGLATTGVAIAAGSFNQLFALPDKTIEALRKGRGKVTLRNTACRLCPGGCSLQVRRIDGLPVSLSGNPLSPVNLGGTCPAAYANLEILYHPDRITTPMARLEGPLRKDLEPIGWEEIESSIAVTINDLVNKKQAYKIAIINGDDSPVMKEVWQNFANWLGTPNFFQEDHEPVNSNSAFLTQGVSLRPKFDLINSDCIVSLGANFLEEEGAPVHMNQVLSQFKDLKNITRNKLIYVGPRANITAASAHKWIPINPDTWGTLALGIAHLLIDEHAIDLEYFRKNAQGFNDFVDRDGQEQTGFETMVRSEFHPKRIEEVTGISEEEIRDLTTLLRSRKKPVVLCGQEALQSPRGDLHLWAVHCLNFLLGSIQRPGGWYFTKREKETKLFAQPFTGGKVQDLFFTDEIHPLEKKSLDIFAERAEGYAPYNIELLIINKANPVYYGENRTKWKTLLKHIPRVVYIGDLANETSLNADVLLPAHSSFEDWDLVEDVPGVPAAVAVLQRPMVKPMYETKSSYEILRSIGEKIDGLPKKLIPGKDSKTLVKKRLQKIYKKGTGQLFKPMIREEWVKAYRNHTKFSIDTSEKTFLKKLLKTGGWWDPAAYVNESLSGVIETSDGKFDFLSPVLKSFEGFEGDNSQMLKNLLAGKQYLGNRGKYIASEDSGYPLTLLTGYPITNPYGRTVYSSTLVETMGMLREMFWENWVEINPETAMKYRVRDGEIIQLDSPVGAIRARVRVRPIIHPEVVFVPLGLGRENVGRFTSGVGSDPRILMVSQPEVFRGNPVFSGTPIRITLA